MVERKVRDIIETKGTLLIQGGILIRCLQFCDGDEWPLGGADRRIRYWTQKFCVHLNAGPIKIRAVRISFLDWSERKAAKMAIKVKVQAAVIMNVVLSRERENTSAPANRYRSMIIVSAFRPVSEHLVLVAIIFISFRGLAC